jgi:hypothetical protein
MNVINTFKHANDKKDYFLIIFFIEQADEMQNKLPFLEYDFVGL